MKNWYKTIASIKKDCEIFAEKVLAADYTNLDDDALMPNTFIESRYNDFKTKNAPITSCNNPKYHYIDKELKIWSCGPGSLFQKKMLKGYDKIINDTLIDTYNDDWCYSTLLWLNGYKFEPCSSYFMQNGAIDSNGTKLKKYNIIVIESNNK